MKNVTIALMWFIVFLLNATISQAQIQVYDNGTYPFPIIAPVNLTSSPSAIIQNFTVSGANGTYGYFDNGASTIGIESGIVLSTGRVSEIPSNSPLTLLNTQVGFAGDTLLNDLFNINSFDAAFIEFDIYMATDTIDFNMVFASEEYSGYQCSSFNDGFGIFVTLVGQELIPNNNIANIPGTNTPISIANIHPAVIGTQGCAAVNEYLYANNYTTSTPLPIAFDGFTVPIQVKHPIVAYHWYHVKIVIGDATDRAYDSALLLGGDIAFSANNPVVNGVNTYLTTHTNSDTIDEQCGQVRIDVVYPYPLLQKDTIYLNTAGTANEVIDYLNLPNYIIAQEGKDTVSFLVTPIADTWVETTESVIIQMNSSQFSNDVQFWLTDTIDYTFAMNDLDICLNMPTSLNGVLTESASNNPFFENKLDYPILDDGTIISVINVQDIRTELFRTDNLESVCLDLSHPSPSDLQLFLISPSGEFVTLAKNEGTSLYDYTNTCFTPSATATIAQSTAPFTGYFKTLSDLDKFDKSNIKGLWKLAIYDEVAGNPTGVLHGWSIEFKDINQVNYTWTSNNPSTLSCNDCERPTISIDTITNYTVIATLPRGCAFTNTITATPYQMPDTASLSCISVSIDSIVATWIADTVASSCEVNINSTGWVAPNDGLNTHIINSLLPNQTVQIQVRCSNGDCIGFEELVYCATPSCNIGLSASIVDDSTVTGNGSVTITVNNGVGGYTYVWTNGMTGNTISNLFPGTYTCIVTDPNNCSATITVNVAGVVNVDNYDFVNRLELFPNPTSDYLNLNLELAEAMDLQLKVLDVAGRLLQTHQKDVSNVHQMKVDLSNYTNGMYFIMLQVGGEVIVEKVSVQK